MSAARTISSDSAGPLAGSAGRGAGRSILSRPGFGGARLVAGAHGAVIPGPLGGPAAPVVGPRQHDRIGRSIIDTGEMRARGCGIVEIAQGDPARHEMEIRPVIFAGGQGGV